MQHGVLADTVLREIRRAKLRTVKTQWGVNDGETDLFGSIVFARRRGQGMPPGTALSLCLRHSNAGRYALTFGFGAEVFVCTNGLLAAHHILSKKHTSGVRLEEEIRGGLERFLDHTREIVGFIERLQTTRVSPRLADRLLVEAARTKTLPWSKLGAVDALWHENPEPAFRRRNAWTLYNCFTEVAKTRSAALQFSTLRGLEGLFRPQRMARMRR